MRVKKLPHILALHLKRFKYMEQVNRYTKLSYRVVFPLELRLFNTVRQPLGEVVIHPTMGHQVLQEGTSPSGYLYLKSKVE